MSRTLSALLVLTSLSSTAFARRLPAPPAKPMPPTVAPMPPNIDDKVTAPTRAQVRAALAKVRAQNLAFFRAYYKAGIYPNNTYSKETLNVWRDEAGHFCAAATIMVRSGNQDLAIKLAEDDNFIKLADVRHGEVKDWITMSGFTQAELVMIQKPFRPVTTRPEMPDNSIANPSAGDTIAMPQPVPVVDKRLRKQETARLLALYKQVDAKLVAQQKKSLDAATNALLATPALAWQLVIATSAN